jgi:dihydropteroate synthase
MNSIYDILDYNHTSLMGILNVTPDSFYDGGQFQNKNDISRRIEEMIVSGVDIIDVGAESSRPYAKSISLEEELSRLDVVFSLVSKFRDRVHFSIDTRKSTVAREALNAGFVMINDISGGQDEEMFEISHNFKTPIVLMHMQGNPENMQDSPSYDNVIDEIITFFNNQITIAKQHGLEDKQIILDPGIGFGKTREDNYHIIQNLDAFIDLDYPILIGVSRKSFLSSIHSADDRLPESLAVMTMATAKGSKIVRVHDVKESFKALQITNQIIHNYTPKIKDNKWI